MIATDGFTGNVVLKTCEGIAEGLFGLVRQELEKTALARLGSALVAPALRGLAKRIDYTEIGGALLVGVSKPAVIAHGRSDATAIASAIRAAARFASDRLVAQLAHSRARDLKNLSRIDRAIAIVIEMKATKAIKVCLTNRGEDQETPWAHDLGPAPGPKGSRKVRLVNVPFLHAKPTWGDVDHRDAGEGCVPHVGCRWRRRCRLADRRRRWALGDDRFVPAAAAMPMIASMRSTKRAPTSTSCARVRPSRVAPSPATSTSP